MELDENGIEPNVAVMHQVVNAQLAAKRSGTHSTKTRRKFVAVEQSYGSKGTGRARAGSSRIPHWRGAGALGQSHATTHNERQKK